MTKEEAINCIIKESGADTNKISDGYHTFEDLYAHRTILFIRLCHVIHKMYELYGGTKEVWRSKKYSDGTTMQGWFIMGINKTHGKQITYHLPESVWDFCSFAETLDCAPNFDEHTSHDVLKRLELYL